MSVTNPEEISDKMNDLVTHIFNEVELIHNEDSNCVIAGYRKLNMEIIQITKSEHNNVFVQNKNIGENIHMYLWDEFFDRRKITQTLFKMLNSHDKNFLLSLNNFEVQIDEDITNIITTSQFNV